MIAVMVKREGDWLVEDVVSNMEHAMSIAVELQAAGYEVDLSDDPYGEGERYGPLS